MNVFCCQLNMKYISEQSMTIIIASGKLILIMCTCIIFQIMKAICANQTEKPDEKYEEKRRSKSMENLGGNSSKCALGQTKHVFECLPCSMTFKTRIIWNQHNQNQHTEKKKFACTVCLDLLGIRCRLETLI